MTQPWAAQLQAWTIYRYLHGHCRVPTGYVVPASELWPAFLHGMALGKFTVAARTNAIMYEPDCFAQLDAIGYEWSPPPRCMHRSVVSVYGAHYVRHVPLSALVQALVAFRHRHGHLNVPDAFVVPENDAAWPEEASNVLLSRAAQTLCAHFYALSDADVATVHGLSLCTELPHWDDTKQLLALYVKITNQRAVPIEFVVPAAAPWPPRFHHVALGEVAWYLGRKRLVLPRGMLPELDALGVIFHTPATWAGVVCGLREYVAKFGSADVRSDFVVPNDWDIPWRGLRLGRYVPELRQAVVQLLVPKATFEALGELLERPPEVTPALLRYEPRPLSPSRKRRRVNHRGIDDEKVDALILYRRLFGDLAIPRDFVVEFLDDRWPAPLGGWLLGMYAALLRHRRHLLPPEKKATLDALGFLWQLKPGAISVTTSLSPKVVTFSVLIAALRAYKAKTGHLDVPAGYAVPLGAPWPSDAAGIFLKPVLTLLRHHFYDLSTNEAEDLHALDVCSDLPSWPAFLELLECFKTEFGHGGVGLDFCVPSTRAWPTEWHRAPLGEVAHGVGLLMAGFEAEKAQQLANTGSLFNSPATWRRTVDGLQQYHRLHRCIEVPPRFVVPDEPAWPQDLRGLQLGRFCGFLKQALAAQMLPPTTQLDVTGMATEAPTPRAATLWAVVVDALKTFRSLNGHTDVPHTFSVPAKSPWRSSCHGLQLGAVVRLLQKHPSIDAPFKATLDTLGFPWHEAPSIPANDTDDVHMAATPRSPQARVDDCPVDVAPELPPPISDSMAACARPNEVFGSKLEALCWFRADHGHLVVPKRYVVPASYPAHLYGMCLGDVVAAMRATTDELSPEQEVALEAIGFPWHHTHSVLRCFLRYPGKTSMATRLMPLQTVFQALLAFRRLFGPVEILPGFVVPADPRMWPAPTHHLALPSAVAALRARFYELNDVDVKWARTLEVARDLPDFDVVVALLRLYCSTFGTCAVARDFSVPMVGGEWPRAWRGLALGDVAWRLGLKAWALDTRKAAQLRATGIVFNVDETWARIVAGLQMYKNLFGSASVPPTYMVPSTAAWPPHLHRMALGHWTAVLKSAWELRLLPRVTRSTIDALRDTKEDGSARLLLSPPATPTNDAIAVSSPRRIVSPESSPAAKTVVRVPDDSSSDGDAGAPWEDDQFQCLTAAPPVDCLADPVDWVVFTRALQIFFRDHGHVSVPFDYSTADHVPLGHLVQQLHNGHVVLSNARQADLHQLHPELHLPSSL